MKKLVLAALAACTVLAAPLIAPAFAAQEPEGTRTLEKVVVTAGRIEEKAKTVTQAMTVIPREEIAKNQYQDLGQMLRNYGLQIDSYNPNNSASQIVMRGMRSSLAGNDLQSPVLLMLDGRRVGTVNVSMIPMVNIERIEILRGPAAVQYGTTAIGGVVNVITRRGGEDFGLSAEAGAGSWQTFRAQGGVAGRQGPVDFSGGASWLTAGDYKNDKGRIYHNTGVGQNLAYSLNLGLNFLDEHRLGFKIMGVDYENLGSPNMLQTNALSEFIDRSNYSYDLDYQGGYKDFGLNWMARYYSGRQLNLYDDRELASYSTYKDIADYQGAQGQVSFSKYFLTLTGGLDWLHSDGKTNGDAYSEAEKSKFENLGAFALAKLSFFDDFVILSGGVRNDDYKLKVGGKEKELNRLTPSAGLALNPVDWLTLRANYGESYRVTAKGELLDFPGFRESWGFKYKYLGNPDLKPEKGKTWDAGFEINYESLNLGLTYFRTDYKDKIITDSGNYDFATNTTEYKYINLEGKTRYRGFEAQAGYDAGNYFDWSFMLRPYVNLTHLLKFKGPDGTPVPNVSRNDFGYGLQFAHPGWGLDVDLRFTYYGRQRQSVYDPVTYASEYKMIGGKTVADLFVAKTIWEEDKKGKLSLKVELRNIAGEKYEIYAGYPQPGRSFFLGVRYDY